MQICNKTDSPTNILILPPTYPASPQKQRSRGDKKSKGGFQKQNAEFLESLWITKFSYPKTHKQQQQSAPVAHQSVTLKNCGKNKMADSEGAKMRSRNLRVERMRQRRSQKPISSPNTTYVQISQGNMISPLKLLKTKMPNFNLHYALQKRKSFNLDDRSCKKGSNDPYYSFICSEKFPAKRICFSELKSDRKQNRCNSRSIDILTAKSLILRKNQSHS